MSLIPNKNNQPEGFHIGSQTSIDDRLIFADLPALINLGGGNEFPLRYYENMRVWVVSEQKEYVWKESPV